MTRDQVINNLRHAPPKLYTMAVAHGLRAAEKKLGPYDEGKDYLPNLTRDDVQALVESIVEGLAYALVPLLAATLNELEAADASVAPPVDPDASTVRTQPMLKPEDINGMGKVTQ